MTKPDGPLTKAGMRRAARLLKMFARTLSGTWVANAPMRNDMMRLSRQLYAKAREPKP